MKEHQVFKTPLIPVIMMVAGLNHILEDIVLSILVGIVLYAAAVWMERIWEGKRDDCCIVCSSHLKSFCFDMYHVLRHYNSISQYILCRNF